MGLRDKGRRGGGDILAPRCRAPEKKTGSTLVGGGNIFHHPGVRLWKLAPRSHPDHSNGTKLVITRGKSKAFDEHFSHFSSAPSLRGSDAKLKTFFVSCPRRVSLLSITSSPRGMLLIRSASLAIYIPRSLIKKNNLHPRFIVRL